MTPSDFHIGLEFVASAGFRWRCTDVGTRTITAIQLTDLAPAWLAGPPYAVQEIVFDEHDLPNCFLTEDDALRYAVQRADESSHPGFPHEAVFYMLEQRHRHDEVARYPHKGLFRFERLSAAGELLHPYAAHKSGAGWVISVYKPFSEDYTEIPEMEFLALPLAPRN